jgi:diphosphoinositol-polyphosphate diphosphatase
VKTRCIPFKLEKNVEDQGCNVEDRVLVLMISTPKRDDLVFPKVFIFFLSMFDN